VVRSLVVSTGLVLVAVGFYDIPGGDPACWPGTVRDKDGYACGSSEK